MMDFFEENGSLLLCYLLLAGIIYAFLFLLGIVLSAAWTLILPTRAWRPFVRRIARLALFLACLFLAGGLFGMLWTWTIFDRLYYRPDYACFDFLPFWPITQSLIDTPFGDERGHLNGVSLFELNLVWFAFDAATWATAIGLYRLVIRYRPLLLWPAIAQVRHARG